MGRKLVEKENVTSPKEVSLQLMARYGVTGPLGVSTPPSPLFEQSYQRDHLPRQLEGHAGSSVSSRVARSDLRTYRIQLAHGLGSKIQAFHPTISDLPLALRLQGVVRGCATAALFIGELGQ